MHTGDKFGPVMCKCMDCAGKRFQRAERLARAESIDMADLEREEAQAAIDLKHAEDRARVARSDKHTLVMTYYHKLIQEEGGK